MCAAARSKNEIGGKSEPLSDRSTDVLVRGAEGWKHRVELSRLSSEGWRRRGEARGESNGSRGNSEGWCEGTLMTGDVKGRYFILLVS